MTTLMELGMPYLGRATAAAGAALPILTSVCSVLVHSNCFGIFNMCVDVGACDCT